MLPERWYPVNVVYEPVYSKSTEFLWYGVDTGTGFRYYSPVGERDRRDPRPTETRAMVTKAKVGFGVVCPCCNDADAVVSIDANDVRSLTCQGCNEEFSVEQAVSKAREALARWERLARWVDLASEVVE
jgi:transcription elongation factor Elf1